MNLYLFDLDRTLINVDAIHKKAYEEAMRKFYNYEGKFEDGKGPGRTAHEILPDMLSHLKREEVIAKMGRATELLVKILGEEVNESHVFPNIKALLFALAKEHKVALFTGGAEPVTSKILKKTGLTDYFEFAVSAEYGMGRPDIVARAIGQAKARFGDISRIYVIGDTHHDIRAAKKNNAVSVAVCSGEISREDLLAEKPDIFFENLQDVDSVLEVIG